MTTTNIVATSGSLPPALRLTAQPTSAATPYAPLHNQYAVTSCFVCYLLLGLIALTRVVFGKCLRS